MDYTGNEPLEIAARSEETFGVKNINRKSVTEETSLIVIATLAIFMSSGIPIILHSKLRDFIGSYFGITSGTKNNTGFVLLHSGNIVEARNVFGRAVTGGEANAYIFANYATCLALDQQVKEARTYLRTADFASVNRYERANYFFNSAIVELSVGDKAKYESLMSKAIMLSDAGPAG